jgi:hypothetical protein
LLAIIQIIAPERRWIMISDTEQGTKIRLGLIKERPVPKSKAHNRIKTATAPNLVGTDEVSEFDQIKVALDDLLKSVQAMQLDVYFIKTRYVKPIRASKSRVSKEERKSELINKMLTRGKKVF